MKSLLYYNQREGGYRMQITKQELQNLYDNNLSKDVCAKLNISEPTLRKTLKDAGIKLKGKGKRRIRKSKVKLKVI